MSLGRKINSTLLVQLFSDDVIFSSLEPPSTPHSERRVS
ncbi:mCG114827 [Mus musculus]|nr:mCG114827 [Mus musculus]